MTAVHVHIDPAGIVRLAFAQVNLEEGMEDHEQFADTLSCIKILFHADVDTLSTLLDASSRSLRPLSKH